MNWRRLRARNSKKIDKTAPAKPSLQVVGATGAQAAAMGYVAFRGLAEAGSTVILYDGKVQIAKSVAGSNGAFSFNVSTTQLTDGIHELTAASTDIAGNTSAASGAQMVAIDREAPAAPHTPRLAAGLDSGLSSSDNITNLNAVRFTGVAEPNSKITLFDGTSVLASADTDFVSGKYEVGSLPILVDGTHFITVTATDKAGNTSKSSIGQNVIIDTRAPLAPTLQDVSASETGGPSLLGVNLAGGEFGLTSSKVYGSDYIFPTQNEIEYYASKSFNVIRLPFLWERLQPSLSSLLSSQELQRIDAVVNYANEKGLKVILDPHDYGTYYGQVIGSAAVPDTAFANFWGQLASHYASNPNVIFGLMNEPNKQTADVWLASENAAIAAIRSAGATQEILVQGTYWDGAATWTTSDNANIIGTGIIDSAKNYAFELHQYLDEDASGTSDNVVSSDIGVQRLTAATQWAETHNAKLFLGEFGVAPNATSLTALDNMMSYINLHSNVWQGATYWAGGPWWGDYMYSIEPKDGVDKPQMAIIGKYAPSSKDLLSPTSLVLSNSSTATIADETATLRLSGLAEARSTVILYDRTTKIGNTVADANGNFVIIAAKLSEGFHELAVTASDVAGNVSPRSSVQTILINTNAALTPAVPVLTSADDTSLASSDGVTNVSNAIAALQTQRAGSINPSCPVVLQTKSPSLNLLVQAMSTFAPATSSTCVPTAATAGSEQMLVASHR